MHALTYNLGASVLFFAMSIHPAISAQGLSTPTTPPDLSSPAPTPEFIPQDGPWEWVKETDEKYLIETCDFSSPTYGWAAGGSFSTYQWDGNMWKMYSSDHPTDVTDPMPVRSPRQVKVISEEAVYIFSTLYEYSFWDGESWQKHNYPLEGWFEDASFLNENFGYVVGGETASIDNPSSRVVLKWNGKEWKKEIFPYYSYHVIPVTAIQILSENDIWAADAIQLYHWDGSYWRGFYTAEEIAKEEYYFNDLELADGNDLWLSGTYKRGDDYGGVIFRWDGETWVNVFESNYAIGQIKMLSPTEGWAMGYTISYDIDPEEIETMVFHWDGVTWSPYYGFPEKASTGYICGFDSEHLWIFKDVWSRETSGGDTYTTLRLRRKATATATATSTPTMTITPVPSQTLTPLPTETPTPIPESIIGDLPAGSVWVGVGVIAVVLAAGIILRQRRNS